jgi:murein DD-endopeptidase MepM/ murein hydrolase activator NlpD
MIPFKTRRARLSRDTPGQGTVEYVLLLALLAVVVIVVLALLGNNLYTVFYGISEALRFGCGQVSQQTFRSYAGEGGPPPAAPPVLPSPAMGTTSQGYWFCHKAIDIAGPEGTPVTAVAAGTVKFAGWSDRGYGYLVVIDHGTYQSLYAHLREQPSVHTGQTVSAGAFLGPMGNTGFSSGPHLHFEIRLGSELVNPALYLH